MAVFTGMKCFHFGELNSTGLHCGQSPRFTRSRIPKNEEARTTK
jgi:hypothetical protein